MLATRLSLALLFAGPAFLIAGGVDTTTILTSSPNPSIVGQSVTLTATVNSPTVTGSIEFWDGGVGTGTDLGPASSFSSGIGTLAITTLAVGPHSLTAVFNSDTNGSAWNNSTSAPITQNVLMATTTTLTSPASPVTYGQAVTLTATLSPTTATGKVTFYSGTTVLGISSLVSGHATLTTTLLAFGPQALKAYYAGDVNNSASTSTPLTQTVNAVSAGLLSTPVMNTAGTWPIQVAVGDFNGDGFQDLAVANNDSANISVFLGIGDGTFHTAVNYSVGANPTYIAAGDFNGDGVTDLAVTNESDSNVSILLGVGDGTFLTAVNYGASTNPFSVSIADFNGDGIADLAVVSSSNLGVFLGNGDGTFQTVVNYAGSALAFGAVGDFNGDHIPDVVVVGALGASVRLGVGDGTFGAAVPVTAGTMLTRVAVGDFNEDGDLDLAIGNGLNPSVSVLLGNGDGTFQASTGYAVGTSQSSVAVADVNGDGHADLVVSPQSTAQVEVLLGAGDGTFAAPVGYIISAGNTSGTAVGDFNGDGRTDLAVAIYTSTSVAILLGTPALTPTTTTLTSSLNPENLGQTTTLTATVTPSSVTDPVAFFNGSTLIGTAPTIGGIATLAVNSLGAGVHSLHAVYPGDVNNANSTSNTLSETVNAGTVTTATLTSSANPSMFGSGLLTATIAPSAATGTVTFYDGATSIGTGTLSAGVATLSMSALAVGVHPLTAYYGGDSLDDGATSLILAQTVNLVTPVTTLTSSVNPAMYGHTVTLTATLAPLSATGKVTFYSGTTVLGISSLVSGHATLTTTLLAFGPQSLKAYYAGDSNNTASTSTALPLTVNAVTSAGFTAPVLNRAGTQPVLVAVGDFNGDGFQDLAVANSQSSNISVFLGIGDGTFHTAVNYSVGYHPNYISAGDLNGDGFTDLAVTNEYNGNVSILLGVGDGTFHTAVNYTTPTNPVSVSIADLNGDGIADLAVTGSTLGVLLGNGDGTFNTVVTYSAGSNPSSGMVGDFNGDGIPDVVVVGGSGNADVLLGVGNGTFAAAVAYAAGDTLTRVAVGDFNEDGVLDLAITDQLSNSMHVLLGNANGTFQTAVDYTAGGSQSSVLVADVNGDGHADLVICPSDAAHVLVLLGAGNGTFAAPVAYATPAGYSTSAAVGDFNGDGRTDIAAVIYNSAPGVAVLLGLAPLSPTTTTITSSLNPSWFGQSVTFTATVSSVAATGTVTFLDGVTTLGSPVTVIAGVATYTTTALSVASHSITAVYSGDSLNAPSTSTAVAQVVNALTVTTTTLTSSLSPSTFGQSITLTATVAPSSATGSVQFFDGATNIGAGALTAGIGSLTLSSLAPGVHSLTAVYSGDTGDAVSTSAAYSQTVNQITSTGVLTSSLTPSVFGHTVTLTMTVAPSSATGKVTFYDGTTVLGIGTLASGVAHLSTELIGPGPQSLKAFYPGDANDLPSTSTALAQTTTSVGGSGFQPGVTYSAVTPEAPQAIALGDFNGDGHMDFVAANANGSITVFLGVGDGTFGAPATYTPGDAATGVTVGDFNGDGIPDLAVSDVDDNGVYVLLGDGTGAFGAAVFYATDASGGAASLAAGDFNRDGFIDLAVTNTFTSKVSILIGKGDGTFHAATTYATDPSPLNVVVGDFNGDGAPDLAITNTSGVDVLLGVGDGTFAAAVNYSTGASPDGIAAGDFNEDGHLDLAVTNVSSSNVSVLLGKGDGTFHTAVNYPAGPGPFGASIADFNGDGYLDLAVVDAIDNTVGILLGDGTGVFGAGSAYAVGANPAAIVTGDFNGDGVVDFIVADQLDNSSMVRLGIPATLPTTTTLTSSANPSVYGQSGSLTATISPSSATGTVTFWNGLVSLGTFPLSGGIATLPLSALPAGSLTLTAVYSGDSLNAPSTSTSLSQTVSQASTTTTLISSANPSTYGQNAAFTLTVLPSTATGTYEILEGVTVLGSGTLVGGVATFSIATLPAGSYTGTVVYSGDSNYASSTSASFAQVVNQAHPTTTLTSSLNPSIYSNPVTLTATVSAAWATGNVTFLDGSTSVGSGTVASGIATAVVSTLGAGAHSLTAVYAGDSNDAGSTSPIVTQTVNQSASTTTLTSSLNPSNYGQSVTFTAHVAGSAATGSVTFKDGSTSIGSGVLTGPTATLTLSTLTAGVHSITAVYGGSANYLTSTSTVLSQTVNQGTTTITFTSSPNPSVYGQSTILTATVSPSTATGTITFKDGATTLGTAALIGGVATFSLSVPAGVHLLSASYAGDVNDLASVSSTLSQTINPANSTITLTSSVNPAAYGQPITLTATVAPSTATGTIAVKDGSNTLIVANLINGVAVVTIQLLASGPHALTAVYSGDVNDSVGTGALELTVNGCAAVNTTSIFLDNTGGPSVIDVSASSSSCSWSASTASPWILLSANGGTGSGTLTATLLPNTTGAVRTGTILVGEQSIAVTERITTQIFADVPPSNIYFDAANMLYAQHITSGCSADPLDYCPDVNIPRWEMAVFIVRSVFGGDNFTAPTIPIFNDVPPGSPGFAWIQEMSVLGITGGCGAGDFCPNEIVPRDQMAVFVIRMRYGSTAIFDFPTTPYFTDVTPDTFGWSWIQRLKEDAITNGCTATTFCPTEDVTRGEMAVFIMAGGFNALLPPGTPVIASISPATITHGSSGTFTITGLNTNFVQGTTTVSPIPGVMIGAITVNSATSLTVQLTAASDAILQPVSIQAITDTEEAVLPNSLIIQ